MDQAPETPEPTNQPAETNDDRHQLLKSRLRVAKQWAKKPHESWREWIAEYNIDDVSDVAAVRDKVRIGYIFRKTESEIPAIFDDQPDLFIKGRTKDFKVIEDIYNSAYDLLWDKQDLESKIEDIGVYFELLGMGFLTSPYVTKTKTVTEITQQPVLDETGQPVIDPTTGQPQTQPSTQSYEVPTYDMPDATVEDPFKLYFSPETQFARILDNDHCPYYFKQDAWTKEKIKDVFGKDVDPQEKLYTNQSEVDIEISQEVDKGSELVKDDFKRVTVYEYYGSLPEEMAKDIKDKDGNVVEWKYDKEYHIFLTKKEELLVEENPYPTKPLFVVGNYGMANEFWKFGDAKHLKPLVQELEQYRSQILMHTRKMANPKPLIETLSEVDEASFNDPRVGKSVKYSGTAPTYLSPAPLGHEVATGVELVRTDLEKTAGSFDLANGGSSSQVKTPRGIQVFSEAADKGVRRKRKKIARFIRSLIIFQLNQLGQEWKPEDNKTLEINGVEEPVNAQVLQVLSDVNLLDKVDIEIESLSINKVQMKQDALDLLDLALKSEAAHPGYLNLAEIWKDTLQNGFSKRDSDRYMIPEEQRQQMQQAQAAAGEQPKVSVSVRADAQTPEGIQLLENENLVEPGQAQQLMQNQQQQAQMQQQTAAFQAAQPQQNKPGFIDKAKSMVSKAIFQPNPPQGGVA